MCRYHQQLLPEPSGAQEGVHPHYLALTQPGSERRKRVKVSTEPYKLRNK